MFKFDAIWLIFTRRNNVIHVGVSELMNGPGPGAAVVKKKKGKKAAQRVALIFVVMSMRQIES